MSEVESWPEDEARKTNFLEMRGNEELISRVVAEMAGPDATQEKLAKCREGINKDLDLPGARGVVSLSETGELKAWAWMHETSKDEPSRGKDNPCLDLAPVLMERGGSGKVFYVDYVASARALRRKRKGAGKEVFEKLLEIGRESGATALVLSVNVKNEEARGMYDSHGFKDLPKIPYIDKDTSKIDPNKVYMILEVEVGE